MVNLEKTPEDILREEFFRERAVVLGRSGESMQKALDKLKVSEIKINELSERLSTLTSRFDPKGTRRRDLTVMKQQTVEEINEQIHQYNRMREYAKLRYYYLIVTREAMGLRRHSWVEKTYPIPPKKKYLQE
jgi:predicted transcriptional regulator